MSVVCLVVDLFSICFLLFSIVFHSTMVVMPCYIMIVCFVFLGMHILYLSSGVTWDSISRHQWNCCWHIYLQAGLSDWVWVAGVCTRLGLDLALWLVHKIHSARKIRSAWREGYPALIPVFLAVSREGEGGCYVMQSHGDSLAVILWRNAENSCWDSSRPCEGVRQTATDDMVRSPTLPNSWEKGVCCPCILLFSVCCPCLPSVFCLFSAAFPRVFHCFPLCWHKHLEAGLSDWVCYVTHVMVTPTLFWKTDAETLVWFVWNQEAAAICGCALCRWHNQILLLSRIPKLFLFYFNDKIWVSY